MRRVGDVCRRLSMSVLCAELKAWTLQDRAVTEHCMALSCPTHLMSARRLFVVGASVGGVRALQSLAAQLPADFPAAVLVVQHIGDYQSILPQILTRQGRLPARHATDAEPIAAGRIVVAPPDMHMIVTRTAIRVVRGPKENHARPAIDPLFRSAAMTWGRACVGVLLTGALDDGTVGLQAIKRCGGTAVVQDPDDAEAPSMPSSALHYVDVDHRVKLREMGELFVSLALADVSSAPVPAPDLAREEDIILGKGDFMENLKAIAKPSTFVCPDCEGSLWEISGSEPKRFRCHTGHGYTLRSLYNAQADGTGEALWGALRALQEKEMLLRALAEGRGGDAAEVARLAEEADEVAAHAEAMRRFIERVPPFSR